jgi:hypothetical protein
VLMSINKQWRQREMDEQTFVHGERSSRTAEYFILST